MLLTPPEPEGYHQGMDFHHFRLLTCKFVTTSHYSHAPLTQALWRPNLDNRNPVSTTVSIVPSEKSASKCRNMYKHRHPTGAAGLHGLYRPDLHASDEKWDRENCLPISSQDRTPSPLQSGFLI